jgi:hypothetical protein
MKLAIFLLIGAVLLGVLRGGDAQASEQETVCTVAQVAIVATRYVHIRCHEGTPGQGGTIFYFALPQIDERLDHFIRLGQSALLSGKRMFFRYTFESAGESTCNAKDCRTALNFGLND